MGTIATSSIPFVLPTLTFLQCFDTDRPGDYYLKVKLQSLDSGRTISEAMVPLKNVNVGSPVVNIVKFGNVQFGNSGAYQLVVTVDDSRDPVIVPFDVVLMPQQQLQGGR
jgi:hypothetical protein